MNYDQWQPMTVSFKDLLNPGPASLKAYAPGKNAKDFAGKIMVSDELICKLSSNENPLGPSPKVIEAITTHLSQLFFYPDPDSCQLKDALCNELQLQKEMISFGNGSDELITQLIRLFANEKRPVLFTKNSFPSYKIAATACGIPYQEVIDLNYNTNLDELLAKAKEKDHSIIFIANPNNPSGGWKIHNEIKTFLKDVPETTIVVLDEAYFEYASEINDFVNSLALIKEHPNLVVLRTFSKAYGLAGLRIGYCIAHKEITKAINTIRLPFNINRLAQVAASAALTDKKHLKTVQKTNSEARILFYNTLKALGLNPLKSASNSLMFDAGTKAGSLNNALIRHGIITRPLTAFGLPSFIRVNTGTISQNNYFITTLCQIVKEL